MALKLCSSTKFYYLPWGQLVERGSVEGVVDQENEKVLSPRSEFSIPGTGDQGFLAEKVGDPLCLKVQFGDLTEGLGDVGRLTESVTQFNLSDAQRHFGDFGTDIGIDLGYVLGQYRDH